MLSFSLDIELYSIRIKCANSQFVYEIFQKILHSYESRYEWVDKYIYTLCSSQNCNCEIKVEKVEVNTIFLKIVIMVYR